MQNRPLIGIAGDAGAGKDTLADALCAHYNWEKYNLALPIKRMLAPILPDPQWGDRDWKEAPIPALGGRSPRYLAQTLGTEWGRRAVHEDFWVWIADRMYQAGGPGMVVADVRFDNEARWIRERGGIVFRIVRPDNPFLIDNKQHISEVGISPELVLKGLLNIEGLQDVVESDAIRFCRHWYKL